MDPRPSRNAHHSRNTRPSQDAEPTLERLRSDCVRMAPHWVVPPEPAAAPVSPSRIRGVTVPAASARLIGSMPEYGG
ncbi:hypothetical protein [Streptomyces clavuligerus]|uniref:hypothetical protein n=1 Tax=Streptomyces clavuligerus TaxID=1901 RepID=UPI00017FF9F3|nr:hypothetical protein [Streptomyces clavuligerus]ANW20552.1 hypothetical protein BB341_21240 [Streptomyces clavuligerus]AXU15180.1 hypothetical protein D1794_22110 [Streptomyces clavuligerus]EDY50129.1 hypothetical protein SSCG_03118 [Streptomyces clavuligerus]MBY6305250.1 hypothetical protein [Streptomyces clavuligerus]QCS07955.1 hypothetical protein CRV15_21475 [Streptomyces clavuligerus]